MSAIAGIVGLGGHPICPATITGMLEVLAHRGPDGCHTWRGKDVGLGAAMLLTMPGSGSERLPRAGPCGRRHITADARIDNRNELISTLRVARPAPQITDSELILLAYERWGEGCLEKLVGDFAFAIWDTVEQNLFCARDAFGVKPFYYFFAPERIFSFASEIKAVLSAPGVPRRLNEERVADYLYYAEGIVHDDSSTFYQDVHRLPPGHSLSVRGSRVRVQRYWTLDVPRELHCRTNQEYAEGYLAHFSEAVLCRMRSAGPVGTMLSGGLDSSSIACMAGTLAKGSTGPELHTFSAVFDEIPECDERSFITHTLMQYKPIPHFINADQVSPLRDLERLHWHQDEPFYAPNLFVHWEIYRAARDAGVRVLMDGFDGDTVVSHGTLYLAELASRGDWSTFASEAHLLSSRGSRTPAFYLRKYGNASLTRLARSGDWGSLVSQSRTVAAHFDTSSWNVLLSCGLKPWVPGIIRRGWHSARARKMPTLKKNGLIRRGFAKRSGLDDRVAAAEAGIRSPMTVREDQCSVLRSSNHAFFLEVMNRAASAFGVELRHPFFDRRLVEFCLSLPPEQKLADGWGRMIARRSLVDILPEPVRWRSTKTDASPLLTRALLLYESAALQRMFDHDIERVRDYVDIDVAARHYRRFREDRHADDTHVVWIVATLVQWLETAGFS